MADLNSKPPLSFARMDIEKRIGFPAGRYTQPGPLLPLILAAIITIGFYAALVLPGEVWLVETFTERGWVPYAIVAFASWAMMIIFVKSQKIRLQRRALGFSVVPEQAGFVLGINSVEEVLERLYGIAEEPRQFLLYNRIQFALSNLKNMGRIGDVDEVLHTRAQNDEAAVESSYTIVKGLIWAIPVLGFIGTVQGLAYAIGAFSQVLNQTGDITELKTALQSVTSGLATAFETTLQALIAALCIQLLMTMMKRNEEQMLDEFIDYCDQQVVNRLRLHTDEASRNS